MYLTRMRLGKNTGKLTLSEVHGIIEQCFEDVRGEHSNSGYGEARKRLWRIDSKEGLDYLILQSKDKPDFESAKFKSAFKQLGVEVGKVQIQEYTTFLDTVREGQVYFFRLVANPTYRPSAGTHKGKVCAHVTIEQQLGWLMTKEGTNGFQLGDYDILSSELVKFQKGKSERHTVTLKVTEFEGFLEVTDKEKFKEMLNKGLGRAKAYGCGLMTVVPVYG